MLFNLGDRIVERAVVIVYVSALADGVTLRVPLRHDFYNIILKIKYYIRDIHDIRSDMKKLKIKNWISCIQDRNRWKLYVERAKTFRD